MYHSIWSNRTVQHSISFATNRFWWSISWSKKYLHSIRSQIPCSSLFLCSTLSWAYNHPTSVLTVHSYLSARNTGPHSTCKTTSSQYNSITHNVEVYLHTSWTNSNYSTLFSSKYGSYTPPTRISTAPVHFSSSAL